MVDIALTTGKIWSFTDDKCNALRLSLPEVLLADTPLYHYPTPSYLVPIQHELLTSILQVAVDDIWPQGLAKSQYSELINFEKSKDVQHTLKQICEHLGKLVGFELTGRGAFMQMPSAWRAVGSIMPIARLMWPFMANVVGSSAKGLRRTASVPGQLGPDLTALFLFSTCVLSKGGTQYWTIGNLAGRMVVHRHEKKTLRQQLFQSVLPNFSQAWNPLQSMPWVPLCHNNGGLEADSFPPWIKYLTGKEKIQGAGNIRFFQSRAIILEPPEQGICDISGNQSFIFKKFRLLKDKDVYEQVKKHPRFSKTKKHAGILTGLYSKQDPPSVVNATAEGEHFITPRPYAVHGELRRITIPHKLKTCTPSEKKTVAPYRKEVSFFHLKYGAQKQDVKELLCYQGNEYLTDSESYLGVQRIIDTAKQSINSLREGIVCLVTKREELKFGKKDKEFLRQESATCKQHVQCIIDKLLSSDIDTSENMNWEYQITANFEASKKQLWNKLVGDYQNIASMSLADHLREYNATTLVLGRGAMYPDLPYLDSRPIVQAGRAFAKAYQRLAESEKYQLFQSEDRCYASQPFWKCLSKARQHDPDLYQPLFEQLLPLLKHTRPIEDGRNMGNILYSHRDSIHSRLIEMVFSETDRDALFEQILHIFQILAQKLSTGIAFDFGIFCYDLGRFNFNPERVIRMWAFTYFHSLHGYKEDSDV